MGATVNYQHKSLAAGRWRELSFCEQMANVGAEVGRAINWRNKGKDDYAQNAFFRALELLDLTIGQAKGLCRLRELCRIRELLVDYFYSPNEFNSSDLLWSKYFDPFNYAARKDR